MIHGRYPHRVRPFSISYYLEKPLLRYFSPDYVLILNDGTEIYGVVELLNRIGIPNEIVLHGIDTTFFSNETQETENDEFSVLFPHRLVEVKRPDLAIEVFEKYLLKKPKKHSKLLFLGLCQSDELYGQISSSIASSKIEIMPAQDKAGMKRLYNHSSVVIGTSLESNMGRAILEAMSCEKTVIVFDNAEISNLIINKDNGFIVPSGDLTGFSEIIGYCSENPHMIKEIGQKARDTIIHSRSWENRITQELKAYKSILNG